MNNSPTRPLYPHPVMPNPFASSNKRLPHSNNNSNSQEDEESQLKVLQNMYPKLFYSRLKFFYCQLERSFESAHKFLRQYFPSYYRPPPENFIKVTSRKKRVLHASVGITRITTGIISVNRFFILTRVCRLLTR